MGPRMSRAIGGWRRGVWLGRDDGGLGQGDCQGNRETHPRYPPVNHPRRRSQALPRM